jgi:hypothetical protein
MCSRTCRSRYDRRPETIIPRFWSFYRRDGDHLLWTGATNNSGYGKFTVQTDTGPKTVGAHRVAWELANNRPIPKGMNVCHSCDIKLCGEPAHLFLGTQRENITDMFSKGRNSFHLPDGSTWG